MPQICSFNPPARGKKGGPLLRLELRDPHLEERLASKRLDSSPFSPYRINTEVENLLDSITFRATPKSAEESLLLLALGLQLGGDGSRGYVFRPAPAHIHKTMEAMRPSILLSHSQSESSGMLVRIAVAEEMCILAVSLMRELGHGSYLSTVETPDGLSLSALAMVADGRLASFVVFGSHPSVSKVIIFDDSEVLHLLGLLRTFNEAKRLEADIESNTCTVSGAEERYRSLIHEYASGTLSEHYLAGLVERELARLEALYPGLKESMGPPS